MDTEKKSEKRNAHKFSKHLRGISALSLTLSLSGLGMCVFFKKSSVCSFCFDFN